jgi:hypothetical protein
MQYHYKEAMVAGVTGSCIPKHYIVGSTYAQGVLSAVVDWTLGIMPIFLVWNLQMNTRTKISVALILAFGAVYDPQVLFLRNTNYSLAAVALWQLSSDYPISRSWVQVLGVISCGITLRYRFGRR